MATGAPDPQDPQKHLVYLWEEGWRSFDERTMSRVQVGRLVRRLARKWRVKSPPVRFIPKGKREWSYLQNGRLWFNFKQCNEAIVCHEMAHYVVSLNYDEVEDHGWEFMSLYLDMLEFAQVAPRVALESSAHAAGIEWLP